MDSAAKAIDMHRDTFEEPLKRLGLNQQNFEALKVLPLVYVAWADGKLRRVERAKVLEVGREKLGLNQAAMQLVHSWLEDPPDGQYVYEGIRLLRAEAHAIDQPELGPDELLQLLWDAEALTRQVALRCGAPYSPSAEQRYALLELANVLDVDSGVSWLALLRELGGDHEVEATLDQAPSAPSRPSPSHADRARRWRTAVRLHESHNHRTHPRGGLI